MWLENISVGIDEFEIIETQCPHLCGFQAYEESLISGREFLKSYVYVPNELHNLADFNSNCENILQKWYLKDKLNLSEIYL
jgi:hypothetical protein